MRIQVSAMLAIAGALCMCATSSCDGPAGPGDDTRDQPAPIVLSVSQQTTPSCDPLPLFRIDPGAIAHGIAPYGAVKIRWDFTNDGIWDTGFELPAILDSLQLRPLPNREWSPRCEILDTEGKSYFRGAHMTLPDWVPAAQDIIVGEMRLIHGSFASSSDSIRTVEHFTVCTQVRCWLLPRTMPSVAMTCYVDGIQANEVPIMAFDPYLQPCVSWCSYPVSGVFRPGRHTITVVFDVRNRIAEVNEDNNTVSREITAVGP